MHKMAFVVLAALSLSACASLGSMGGLNTDAPVLSKVDAEALSDVDGASGEPIVVTDRDVEASPEVMATMASPAPFRRAFGHPTRHQPDLRLVLATATDRMRFQRRRRRVRRQRIAPMPGVLLTS